MASLFLLGAHPLSLSQFRGHLIADLVARGHRVFACAPDLEGDLAQAVVDLGGEPLSLTVDRHGLGPLSNLRYAAGLETLMRKIRPDVFLGYTAKPVVWGAPAARAAGVGRVAALITGLGYAFIEGREVKRRFVRLALSQLYRRALARCDEVIFQNPDDRDTFVRLALLRNGQQAHVVNGSGVDLSHYHPVPVPTTTGQNAVTQANFLLAQLPTVKEAALPGYKLAHGMACSRRPVYLVRSSRSSMPKSAGFSHRAKSRNALPRRALNRPAILPSSLQQ